MSRQYVSFGVVKSGASRARVNVLERSVPRRAVEPPEERCGTAIVERDVPAARIVADQEQLQTVEAARQRVGHIVLAVGRSRAAP